MNKATKLVMSLADKANQYIDEKKPWAAVKDPERQKEVHDVCTMGINLFRFLMIYLKPILPDTAKKAEMFLAISPLMWADKNKPLLNHAIQPFQPLLQRLEKIQIEAMKAAALEDIKKSTAT